MMKKQAGIQSLNSERLISGFIDQAIAQLPTKSPMVRRIQTQLGQTFITNHYCRLKKELLLEIPADKRPSRESDVYVPLEKVFPRGRLQIHNRLGVKVYQRSRKPARFTKNKYLVNLVFPCRNSGATVMDSTIFLLGEVIKSHDIDFNIVFQVNNSSDNTIQKIADTLRFQSQGVKNASFYIIESARDRKISLPGSLNLGFDFLDEKTADVRNKYRSVFFSFWDDELLDLIPTPDSLFNANTSVLLSSKTNKAISGYMIDNRLNLSRWHEVAKGFSSDIRFIHSKPYLHGGAGTVVRWDDYPVGGINQSGIADTDLSASLLLSFDEKTLKKLDYENWPVRSNPHAPVFHPIETDILKWTTKYLMYQISWENTHAWLDRQNSYTSQLWEKRIRENRTNFHKRIDVYIKNLSPQKILDREFMHFYYKTVYGLDHKKALYAQLKVHRNRSLEIG